MTDNESLQAISKAILACTHQFKKTYDDQGEKTMWKLLGEDLVTAGEAIIKRYEPPSETNGDPK